MSRVRIASLPGRDHQNPYITLFYKALEENGIEQVEAFEIRRGWLRDRAGSVDALHLHWPEFVWRSHVPGAMEALIRANFKGSWRLKTAFPFMRGADGLRNLAGFFREMKRRGLRFIWTYHNAEPHENTSLIDRLGYKMVAAAADLIICHGPTAMRDCRERFRPAGKIVVMPFGNYDGIYPAPRDRESVIRGLGLDPQVPTISSLGIVRPYKGLDVACRAIARLGGRVQYIFGGGGCDSEYGRELRELTSAHPWVRIIPRELTDQEFADIGAASDAILLPYRKITGSSAILAALTFHRGVIASDLPFFREALAGEPDAGVLADPTDPAALAVAIESYLGAVPRGRREDAARRLSERYRWSNVIHPVVEAIRSWPSGASGGRIGA